MQITYQDKSTQTNEEETTQDLFSILTTLSLQMTEVEKRLQIIEAKNLSQQHGSKHAELSQQHGSKHADLGGDVGKHLKTQNLQTNTILHTVTPKAHVITFPTCRLLTKHYFLQFL